MNFVALHFLNDSVVLPCLISPEKFKFDLFFSYLASIFILLLKQRNALQYYPREWMWDLFDKSFSLS